MVHLLKLGGLSLLLVLAEASAVVATSINQGYAAKTALAVGTIVSVAKDNPNLIEPSTTSTDSQVVGTVANGPDALINLQPQGANIRVATSGAAPILVATTAGDVKRGDHLVVSPLAGIAERDSSSSKAAKYIGIAGSDFSASSSGAKSTTVKLSNGGQKTVALGLINATILITDRASQSGQSANVLSRVGEYITGRQVSSVRVIASAVVMLSVFMVTGWLLNGSIKGSFVSLGRNPLARLSIISSLLRVIMITLVVFAAGLTASYLVLAL